MKHHHITPNGVPCVWPPYSRYIRKPGDYPRHSGTIWPQVTAAWAMAASAAGHPEKAWFEIRSIAEKACRDVHFFELFHPDTGLPYGGLQENMEHSGVIEWPPCRAQSWCASGFIQMILSGYCGLKYSENEISFENHLPEGMEQLELEGLHFRRMTVHLILKQSGSGKKRTLDGNLTGGQTVILAD